MWLELAQCKRCLLYTSVREHLKSQNIPQKAVLLIDNALSHPGESVFKSENGNFFVKFLPPNVTALFQPMDQGVIASIKKIQNKLTEKKDLRGE